MQLQQTGFRFDLREVRPATAVLIIIWALMFIVAISLNPNLIVYGIFVAIGLAIPYLADLFDYLFGW